jgi:hypothetical protein
LDLEAFDLLDELAVDLLELAVLGGQHLHVLKRGTAFFLARKALVLLGEPIDGLFQFFYFSLPL